MKKTIPIIASIILIGWFWYVFWSMQQESTIEPITINVDTKKEEIIQQDTNDNMTKISEKTLPTEDNKKIPVGIMERKPVSNTAMERKPTSNITTDVKEEPIVEENNTWRKVTKDTSYLTALQFEVTVNNATEPAYKNLYWDNHEKGIYVDIIDGTPLFSSTDKYDSQTWWPSFTKGINENAIWYAFDVSAWMTRVEAFSNSSNAHLWHVFDDGPTDRGGKRFCINSASLKFIPYEKMKEAWYEKYLTLFQ